MSAGAASQEAIWQEVECGGYAADLSVWAELASAAGGPVLDLGAGVGRVTLDLAGRGHRVTAVDFSEPLLGELRRRAEARGLEVETICGDVRLFEPGESFGAVLAPMQLVHIIDGPTGRAALLDAVRRQLAPGAAFAAAVLSDAATWAPFDPLRPPAPDVREVDGWVYSSLSLEPAMVPGGIEVRRLRQVVSPAGELTEQFDAIRLDTLTADDFELEARRFGLIPRERIVIDPSDEHVGTVVCVLAVG